jgi:hypothetical protein
MYECMNVVLIPNSLFWYGGSAPHNTPISFSPAASLAKVRASYFAALRRRVTADRPNIIRPVAASFASVAEVWVLEKDD